METILSIITFIDLALVLYLIWILIQTGLTLGNSIMGRIVMLFILGSIALATVTSYIILFDLGILQISEETLIVAWHFTFYLATLLFFIGAKKMSSMSVTLENTISQDETISWSIFTVFYIVLTFLISVLFNKQLTEVFSESIIFSSFGIEHFLAFAFTGIVTYYLIRSKQSLNTIGIVGKAITVPLIISMALWSLNHLWELITESWMIIQLSSDTIESVEQVIILPAILALIVGFSRLKKAIN